jgi:sugar/nucleoside kinase (ribokinase family)
VGLATRDTILVVPAFPQPDGRVLASDLAVAGGGPAATAAVTLSRLGVEAAFVGAVGDDDAGGFVRAGLEAEGVDVTHLAVVTGARTAESVILVDADGGRSIVHHPGTATVSVTPDALEGATYVHVDHVGYPHVQGLSLDVALSVDGGNPIEGLRLDGVAVYAPTEQTLREQFGDAQAAVDAGADTVVVTRGARGCVATTRAGEVEAPATHVDALSTLGAGDVFHGALLAWLAGGASLQDALRAANTAAALSCRALDGRSAIPTRDELERSLA